jgi:PleD family two-component response regulator
MNCPPCSNACAPGLPPPAEGVAGPHGCTFSMGAAQLDMPMPPSLDELIAEADRQLYRPSTKVAIACARL